MKNAERLILASVRRYAEARGLPIKVHADGWIVELELGPRSHIVHGYDLGLNTASSARVANDKAATFEVLSTAGIPAVPHHLFMHPRFLGFMSIEGNWRAMLDCFEAFGRDGVLKDNEGTGGMELARIRSVADLEQATQRLFNTTRALSLSPYLDIACETRFILLDGDCLVAYRKERPSVTGDGRRTLAALVAEAMASGALAPGMLDIEAIDPAHIPPAGATVPVQWRHNLGLGARAVVIDPAGPDTAASSSLARRAFDRLGLRFASIDIVRTHDRDLVLEANAGVMLEVMAYGHSSASTFADAIYHRVLDRVLDRGV